MFLFSDSLPICHTWVNSTWHFVYDLSSDTVWHVLYAHPTTMKESILLMDTENPDICLPHMYSLSQYYLRKCWYAHTISIKEVWWEWNMGEQNSQRVLLSLLLLLFHCSKNTELLGARLIQDFPWGHDMSLKQGTCLAGLALAWSQGLSGVFFSWSPDLWRRNRGPYLKWGIEPVMPWSQGLGEAVTSSWELSSSTLKGYGHQSQVYVCLKCCNS